MMAGSSCYKIHVEMFNISICLTIIYLSFYKIEGFELLNNRIISLHVNKHKNPYIFV